MKNHSSFPKSCLIPEMSFSKNVAGTTFQVLLKMLSLLDRLKRDVKPDLPWHKLGRMRALLGVVVRQSLSQISGMSEIAFTRMVQALEHVGIEHGLPSIAWNLNCGKSSFAKPMEDILGLESSRWLRFQAKDGGSPRCCPVLCGLR